ncbi:hypothetical protein PVT68_05370 [Microbulbifer bruguierae]|uniref:Uncharacterized protein n=1 Tax=Microbulbifer bruguierae TaxID=3029061 RepID=A0ABY8NGB4_9GAMM|nr:hypothetical protein [Microbulbifer bruguierae]WGL17725.1 hypothetical protein PVT68_05370 [Microbulbifer bruguierae]
MQGYAKWLKNYCKSSEDPYIADSEKMLTYFYGMDKKIPDKYGWKYTNVDSFKNELQAAKSVSEANRIYWEDQFRNIESFNIATVWRTSELLRCAVKALNSKDLVPAAVLSRSLLEIAASHIYNANIIRKEFVDITFPENALVMSEELEKLILKMVWGTRYGDPEEYRKQKNVLTYIQKISKNKNAVDLLDIYEYLCDVAHPSYLGSAKYWSSVDKKYPTGAELRRIERNAEGPGSDGILYRVVWSLGWSSATIRNAFEMIQEGGGILLSKVRGA